MVVRIGTSGWSYDHWCDVLYPCCSRATGSASTPAPFDIVETNSIFYHWPREVNFSGWRRRAPERFIMSVMAPRGLTHAKKLYAPEQWVERITTAWHELGDARGLRATARFVHVRLHGPDTGSLYAGSYSDDDLRWSAGRVREWDASGRDVFAYFNNDGNGNAVRNAQTLRQLVAGSE